MWTIDPHPSLDLAAFTTTWPGPIGSIAAPDPEWLDRLCRADADTPLPKPDDASKEAVRALLRVGGFKPAGRSKPCNEYIRGAAEKDAFPRINAVVDLTNAAALHGGLPICTIDLDRVEPPLRVGVAPAGAKYVFNLSGQEIDLAGLLCLFDAEGPCANAVKDAQRSKTTPETTRTLTLVWGTTALPGRAERVRDWLIGQFAVIGGQSSPVEETGGRSSAS